MKTADFPKELRAAIGRLFGAFAPKLPKPEPPKETPPVSPPATPVDGLKGPP